MPKGDTRVARSETWQRQGRTALGPLPYVGLEMPVKNLATWNGNGSGGYWSSDGYGDDAWTRYATGPVGPTMHVGYNGATANVISTVVGTESAWCLGVPSIKCNILTIRPTDFASISAGSQNSNIDSLVDSFTDTTQETVINFWMEIDGYIRGRSGTLYSGSTTPTSQQKIDKAAEWRAAAIVFGDRVHARLAATGRPRKGPNSVRVSINTTQTAYEPDGSPTYANGTSMPYNTYYWDGSTSGTSGNMWGAIDIITHNLYCGDGKVSGVGFSNGPVYDFVNVSMNYLAATTPIAAGKPRGILELGCVEAGFNSNAANLGWSGTKGDWINAVMTYAIANKYFVLGLFDFPNGNTWQFNSSAGSVDAVRTIVTKGRRSV